MKIDCPHCQEPVEVTIFPAFAACPAVLFKSLNDRRNPTYLFHLHAMCNQCGRYISTLKQNPDTIEKLRTQITQWRVDLQHGIANRLLENDEADGLESIS